MYWLFGIIIKRNIKDLNIENRVQVISLGIVISYLISAMFGNSMYYTSPYFFVFLGYLMSISDANQLVKRQNIDKDKPVMYN